MVSVGNHESECHSPICVVEGKYRDNLSNFTAYNHRWKMPSEASGGVLSMWYSYDYGPVHFVSLNTETDYPGAPEENKGDSGLLAAGHFAPDGEYLRWLEADLKAASEARGNRTAGYRNWIVAGGHRPYGDIKGNGVEEMFQKYGVDLYISGHLHSYMRSAPSFKYSVDHKAMINRNHYHDATSPAYIVVGGAGCDEMTYVALTNEGVPEGAEVINEPVPFGTALDDVSTDKEAIGLLNVVNTTALHWVLLESSNGNVLDELWLTKSS
eukprot:c8169_g1_i1.p2 GENE.c8169_g1_i1~~c8169_g1_i1.p2  ORF type:complete len:268 (-),score=59.97 c8169_g1_i1:39-842(-)